MGERLTVAIMAAIIYAPIVRAASEGDAGCMTAIHNRQAEKDAVDAAERILKLVSKEGRL